MNWLSLILPVGLVALAGCGDDDGSTPTPPATASSQASPKTVEAPATRPTPRARTGTAIAVRDSQYGAMLFNSKKQATYIFENDPKARPSATANAPRPGHR